jgi:hypothetical protein
MILKYQLSVFREVYLMTSVTQILYRPVVGQLINNIFENMCMEAVVAEF